MTPARLPFAFAAMLLSACAAPAYVSPVEVTRFSAPAVTELGQGTISLHAAPQTDGSTIAFGIYRAAVAAELERLGYRVVPDMGAQVATIAVTEEVFHPGRSNPVTVGGNAGVGSYGSGVGLGVGIDLTRHADRIDRHLAVTIRRADATTNLWEGRAQFVATANSAFAQSAAAAARAAAALFADFPGESGATVDVE